MKLLFSKDRNAADREEYRARTLAHECPKCPKSDPRPPLPGRALCDRCRRNGLISYHRNKLFNTNDQ